MDLSEPAAVLAPGLTVALLRALASRGDGATADQLRRAAGTGTETGVRRALDRLAEHGLVLGTTVGERTTVYELNRNHVVYPVTQAMLAAGDALPQRLSEVIAGWVHTPESAALYGSAARRDGGLRSDIDLLVVRPSGLPANNHAQWNEQLHDLRSQVRSWTGNHLQLLDRTAQELAGFVQSGEAIIEEWQREAVTVHGKSVQDLLRELQ